MENKQQNGYMLLDSCGRPTNVRYCASNKQEAMKLFKADKDNYKKYYYGKLARCYNGGARG